MRQRTEAAISNIQAWLSQTIDEAKPGDRLPTVRQIMQRFSTAQRTVEAALRPYVESGQLQSRPGAGIVVGDPGQADAKGDDWEGDLLVLYRTSDSRLAHNALQEIDARLSARNVSILQIGYSDEAQALSVLEKIGRFRTALLQANFEVLSIAFLAALHKHVARIVIDGVSATGIDVDAIGTNWREALSVAFRIVRRKGHERIAFLTSAHHARQIAMARREFRLLCESLPDPAASWLVEVPKLPGSYQVADLSEALSRLKGDDGRLPFTALIVWGVVEGYVLDRALTEIGCAAGGNLSVVLLGSTDFTSEHLGRYDVVGNSNADKLNVFEEIIMSRIALDDAAPETVYLPVSYAEHGSLISL